MSIIDNNRAKFIVEPTLRNAIATAKREMRKYFDQPGSYGGIEGMADTMKSKYYLRDDETEYLQKALEKHAMKEPLYYKWIKR